jgi:hypothetical protein
MLHWRCHLGTTASPPESQTGIFLVMRQLQHVISEALLLHSTSSLVASSLYPALAYSDLAFDGLAKAAMAFFWCCAGVLARLLPASSCPCCQCCTSVVAKLAFKGPARSAALAFACIALAFCPHCTGVIASIVLLSLSPVLRRCHCPCRVGTFVSVLLAS